MQHLIFQPTDHQGPIPYAQSRDLVTALLDFDAEVLEDMGVGSLPELFLLQKACALKAWALQGEFPRFFIAQQVEVVMTCKNRAFVRLLNARSHKALHPLTLEALQREISACLQEAHAWQTKPEVFLDSLFKAWQALSTTPAASVPLSAIYQYLYQPGYRREYFGLDLNRCLNSGLTRNRTHFLSIIPATASAGQAFFVFDTSGTGQWIDQIAFLPLEN